MQLNHNPDVELKYVWKCTNCWHTCSVQKSSMLGALNLKQFDLALTLWMMNAKTLNAAKMI